MRNYRDTAYALLRVTLGVIFLTTGVVKFMFGIGNFAAGLQQEFAGTLPMLIVTPFAYGLPFVEVTVARWWSSACSTPVRSSSQGCC